MTEVYPKELFDFCDPLKEYSLNYLELCNLGNSLDVNVSPQQQSNAEKLTIAPTNSKKMVSLQKWTYNCIKSFLCCSYT